MKKFLAMILAVVMALSMVCIASAEEEMRVAMITDYGDITTSPSTRPPMKPAKPGRKPMA